jgi:hypothetical protein
MIRIVRDFYEHPDEVLEFALNSKYQLISNGNYPGKDSLDRMIVPSELTKRVRELFPGDRYQIECSRFRYALDNDTYMSYVHADSWCRKSGWHILVYLTKNPPERDGITLYESKDGQRHWRDSEEEFTWDFPEWVPWMEVGYEYNHAVVIDYSYFHSPMNRGGFGTYMKDSRILHIIEVVDTESPANKDRVRVKGVSVSTEQHPHCREDYDETLSWSDTETASYERVEYFKY